MRRIALIDELARTRPELEDPGSAIAAGLVRVDGSVVTNPRSLVRPGCSVVVERPRELRGSLKLRGALDAFGIDVGDRVCLDVGAAAGGFTAVLLERGARRIYAVDAGHGQLLGSLRQDPRVVTLERTNVATLDRGLVPDTVDLVTVDVSYLPLREAVAQLDRIATGPRANLVGLVKPMFELKLAEAPTDPASLRSAIGRAAHGLEASGWTVVGDGASPVTGGGGAVEGFVHAIRDAPGPSR